MIRILIADDHPIVRQGLKQILMDESDVGPIGEARNAQQALELCRGKKWDILILDITMPGRGGLEVLKDMRREQIKIPVLVLSIHPEDLFGVRALRAGASGYMTKESAPENLVQAIRKILSGGKYVSSTLAEKLVTEVGQGYDEKPAHEILSDREFQVLCRIASGKTVSQIASELFLSVKTISTYRTRILDKMNLKSNAQLTHYAIKNRLID